MLLRCSDKKDMTEWNEWRKKNRSEDILLEGAIFTRAYLKGAYLNAGPITDEAGTVQRFAGKTHLEGADFSGAHLEGTFFNKALLQSVKLKNAHLEDVVLYRADLRGTNIQTTIVNSFTSFWYCKVDRHTDFTGTGLDAVRIHPGTKQLLEYNIRRKNWKEWYEKGRWLTRFLKKLFIKSFFWAISDYGRSTGRIIATFFMLAFLFALAYCFWPDCVMVNNTVGDIRGFWHSLYFSVVTMTTLGFGDIAANPDSWWGQTLLMAQVILGYVLLGALVTRFAVLFTAGGPAGKFANEKATESAEK